MQKLAETALDLSTHFQHGPHWLRLCPTDHESEQLRSQVLEPYTLAFKLKGWRKSPWSLGCPVSKTDPTVPSSKERGYGCILWTTH